MLPEVDNGHPIIHRATDYVPPRTWHHWLFGRPLTTADAPHQTIGKFTGLAIFASDALSSTAYATQEILFILAAAGTMAFGYVFPISIVIVILLAIVSISYEQIIHAYPDGGGAYIVARDNMGKLPSLIAGASLLTDYILTVSVSVSAGVAQIVSAYPELIEFRVLISVIAVFGIMLMNLRGVRESGAVFAFPSYFFVAMLYLTLGVGLFRYFSGSLGMVESPPSMDVAISVVAITPFLLLHAFSSGTAALTGIEAISNGIPAFKEPRSRNAGITLIWMAFILGSLFMGISYLTGHIGAVPSETETVISQLARTVMNGRGLMYQLVIWATTVILILAANTAFAGFPRLSAIAAKDGFLPRQMTFRGSRLVYSYGILTLALIASVLIIIFQASVNRLIPLYAIGVFTSFTLSQAGMTHRWWKIGHLKPGQELAERGSTLRFDRNWQIKMAANGFGAICTTVVILIFAVTKFLDGAWMVLILIPLLVFLFSLIHRHYHSLANRLSLEVFAGAAPRATRHRVILPLSGVHQGSLEALRYARRLSDDITAVHVSIDPDEAVKVRQKWETWGEGVRLVILDSPYRLFIEPLLEYVEEILIHRQPDETITIVVPQFIPSKAWHNLLHTNTANLLRKELLSRLGIIITDVPYQVP
ncbi:MAG: APC family permease [Chloroflexota bacterium]